MLKLTNISLELGGLQILQNLSFTFEEGKIIGVIGPNGAGKSTLFNVLSALIPQATGSWTLRGQELAGLEPYQVARMGITRTFQDSQVSPQMTVLENLLSASPLLRDVSLMSSIFRFREMKRYRAEAEAKALDLLKKVGLQDKAQGIAGELSYGQSKLIEVLKVFMSDAEMVFLDEPFSGLFPEMIQVVKKLVYELVQSGRTIVLVEHNMKLIDEVCDHIFVLDFGKLIGEGTFEEIRRDEKVVEAYLGS